MMKTMLVGAAVAQTLDSASSFCGCGSCSIDWLPGSSAQQFILLGLSCSQFVTLMKTQAAPAIAVSGGEACTTLVSEIRGATIVSKAAADFIGPNTTCPSGLSVSLASEKEAAEKIRIDLYYESQCPGCKQLITTSFAEAMKTDGFLDMAEIYFWPYGNARETQTANGWEFTCQHGAAECQYNFIETCAVKLIECPVQLFNFMNCMETNDVGTDYEGVANKCATDSKIANIEDIMKCYNGPDASLFEHYVAAKTEQLSPPHQYVPWVTVRDQHSEEVQDQISESLLKYVCDNYTGQKSAACPKSDAAPIVSSTPRNYCLKVEETAFLQ
jgi:interferon gamma-inducible protein 30